MNDNPPSRLDTPAHLRVKQAIANILANAQTFDGIAIDVHGADHVLVLREGKWVKAPRGHHIRIDPPTSGAGQKHAHIYGRKGNEVGVVNLDGTSSHGTKVRLRGDLADALRGQGFTVRDDNIVEWIIDPALSSQMLFG